MIIPYPKTVGISSRKKKLLENYICKLPNDFYLFVEKGIIYDGASIPKIFWSIIGSPFTGKYQRGAFIHDILYMSELFSRKICDEIFLEIMKIHHCGWLKKNIIWLAVRIFGCLTWWKHKKRLVEEARTKILIFSR